MCLTKVIPPSPLPPLPRHTRETRTPVRVAAGMDASAPGLWMASLPVGRHRASVKVTGVACQHSFPIITCVLHIVVACKREWESRQPDAAPATATAAPLHALHASRWPEGGRGRGAATAEYMLLPRMCATAEVLWSPAARKDWRSFRARLPHVLAHCEALGIRRRPLT